MVLMIERLLAGKSLDVGEEYEYISIDPNEPVEPTPHSTPKKGEIPIAAILIENIKKLSTDDLKQILATISDEMVGRKHPLETPK